MIIVFHLKEMFISSHFENQWIKYIWLLHYNSAYKRSMLSNLIDIVTLTISEIPIDQNKWTLLCKSSCHFIEAVVINWPSACTCRGVKMFVDLVCVGCQATGLFIWPLTQGTRELWLTPVAIALISLGHWENFVPPDSRLFAWLGRSKSDLDSKYLIYLGVSLWKMLLFLCSVIVIFYVRESRVDFIFNRFTEAFSEHRIPIQEVRVVF